MQCHSASNPSEAKSPRTVPNPRPSRAVTFSTMTSRGRISPIRRANSLHSPLRDPARPFPAPARLTSWQGNPPMIASGSIPSRRNRSAVSVRTSSYCATPGKRADRVARASLSISQKATVSNPPARSRPRSNAPHPEKSERTLSTANTQRAFFVGHAGPQTDRLALLRLTANVLPGSNSSP